MNKLNKDDNMQEYQDAELYDTENEMHQADVECLLNFAEQYGGPIVDLACGTGRATIPLAQAGYQVVGIDLSSSMLAQAEKKAASRQVDVTWLQQDCTRFNLPDTSPLIFSVGNSFQHILTNQEQEDFLKSVAQHLSAQGRFIFDLRFPSREELLQPEHQEEYSHTYTDHQERKVEVYYTNSYEPISQIQTYLTRRVFYSEEKVVEQKVTTIRLRYTYPQELIRLLESCGLQPEGIYHNWKLEPLTEEANTMVVVCGKKNT